MPSLITVVMENSTSPTIMRNVGVSIVFTSTVPATSRIEQSAVMIREQDAKTTKAFLSDFKIKKDQSNDDINNVINNAGNTDLFLNKPIWFTE